VVDIRHIKLGGRYTAHKVRSAVQPYKPPELRQTKQPADFKQQFSSRITTNGDTIAVRNGGTQLIKLGGLKYLRLGHWYRSMALLSFRFLFGSRKYVGQTTGSDQVPAELTESVTETLLRREDLQLTPIYVDIDKCI